MVGRWGDNTAPDYRLHAQGPHFNQEHLAFRGPELERNHSGGYEYTVSQAPLPELLGPAGSLLPRERPSSQTSQSQYDYGSPYALYPLAPPESTYEATEEPGLLPPEYLQSRPSMLPDSLPTELFLRDGNAANRVPERKGAYNPLRQPAQPEKAKEDSVSDAELQRLLNDCALLDEAEPEAVQQVESRGWANATEDPAAWRQNVGSAESSDPNVGREGERMTGTPWVAHTAGRAGVNGAVRTAAQMVAGRPDEEQFEADTKAAMDVSLTGKEMRHMLIALCKSARSIRSN